MSSKGFLVIGVAVVVGYLVGRLGVLGDGATVVLSKAAFFVATPALLFTTLARPDPADVFSLNLLVVGVTSAAVCLLFVPLALLRRRPAGEITVGSMATGYVNAGNIGLPIATYALGGAAQVAPALIFQLAPCSPRSSTSRRPARAANAPPTSGR